MGYAGTWYPKEMWIEKEAEEAWGDPAVADTEFQSAWRFLAAILDPRLSHIRPRKSAGHAAYHACVYYRDPTSPTGVMLETMCLTQEEADPIINRYGKSSRAVSPTEPV